MTEASPERGLDDALEKLAAPVPAEKVVLIAFRQAESVVVHVAEYLDPELLMQGAPTLVACVQLLSDPLGALLLLPATINSAQRKRLHSIADCARLLHPSVGSGAARRMCVCSAALEPARVLDGIHFLTNVPVVAIASPDDWARHGETAAVWAPAMALASALENDGESLIGAVAAAEEVEARRSTAAGAG